MLKGATKKWESLKWMYYKIRPKIILLHDKRIKNAWMCFVKSELDVAPDMQKDEVRNYGPLQLDVGMNTSEWSQSILDSILTVLCNFFKCISRIGYPVTNR